MSRRIVIIQGHPDPAQGHLCHALADAYAQAAEEHGREIRRIDVASLNLPLLQTKADWETGTPPDAVRAAWQTLIWAEHLVIIYPLWLGGMPAVLKGFLEQVCRPALSDQTAGRGGLPRRPLRGRSARIVVTMGMPVWLYRWYFRAHSLKSLERNILALLGIRPSRESLFGLVESVSPKRRQSWLQTMSNFGRDGR